MYTEERIREITEQTEITAADGKKEVYPPFRLFRYFRLFRNLSFFLLSIVSISMMACAGGGTNVGSQPNPEEALSKLKSCLPPSEPEGALALTIVSVTSGPDDTKVRLVARAVNEAVDFDLPVYRLSYGRWMINERGRAYLIDDRCREYRLKDRKSASGEKIPPGGRIRLKPGQAFETILIFPGFIGQPRRGGLIYGGRTLAFMLGAQS